MFIGLSTGCLYKNKGPISKDAINDISSTGCNAIELCAASKDRIYQLDSISNSDLKAFDYVSLHAPDDVIFDGSTNAKMVLDEILKQHERLDFDLVVIHGHNVVSRNVLKNYNLPFAIENHDTHFGKNVAEMELVFKNFDGNMVLDVLHSYIAGKSSAELTKSMNDEFKNRIVQIHLSGLGVHDDSQQHYPIYITRQLDILNSIPKNIPVIIESVLPKYDSIDKVLAELKNEYSYVKSYLLNGMK